MATCKVLLFVWFQYAQYQMLVERVPSAQVQHKEPLAMAGVGAIATLFTVAPLATGHIGPRENFYGFVRACCSTWRPAVSGLVVSCEMPARSPSALSLGVPVVNDEDIFTCASWLCLMAVPGAG